MKTNFKNKVLAFLVLLTLGATVQPVLGMNTKQNELNKQLFDAIEQRKHVREIEQLLRLGANVNATNNYGDTPLFLAANKNNLDALKLLLQHGADITIQNKDKKTAYDRALEEGKHDICTYLKHVENYNTTGTMVVSNQENQLVAPDYFSYFSLAVIKQDTCDIKKLLNTLLNQKESVEDCLSVTMRLNKKEALYELAWIKVNVLKGNPYIELVSKNCLGKEKDGSYNQKLLKQYTDSFDAFRKIQLLGVLKTQITKKDAGLVHFKFPISHKRKFENV